MRIAIIGAMEEEVSILRENMTVESTEYIANSEFTVGTLQGKEVVLLKSGIGKVNAAMTTTILLDRFKPEYVLNTGSAGGLNEQLNVGDLVISTEVRHHDVDVTAFQYEYGQVPGLPAAFQANETLMTLATEAAEDLDGIQAIQGVIVTGDSFMNDESRVDYIRQQFKQLDAVEMEAAAIAQVCHQFAVPFVIIRSLSDIAGKQSDISFEQFLETAAKNSAELIEKIVNKVS